MRRILVYDAAGNFTYEMRRGDLRRGSEIHLVLGGVREGTLVTTRVMHVGMRVLMQEATGRLREFVIDRPDEEHERGDVPVGTYGMAWSLAYDLTTCCDGGHFEPGMAHGCGAATALGYALDGQTRWGVGTCDVLPVEAGKGVVMLQDDAATRVSNVAKAWHAEIDDEIEVDATGVVTRRVALLGHVGATTVTRRFDFGRDCKSIRRTADPGPYYSRVVPLGKAETEYAEDDETQIEWRITLTSDPEAYPEYEVDWIQDDEADALFRTPDPDAEDGWHHPTKYVRYDTDDVGELYEMALEDLHNHTRPKVAYEGDFEQFVASGMGPSGVELGQDVHVVDRKFGPSGLRIEDRVVELTQSLTDDSDVHLVLGQVTRDLLDELEAIVSVLTDTDIALDRNTRAVSSATGRLDSMSTAAYVHDLIGRINAAVNATGGYSYLVPGIGLVTYDSAVSDPAVGAEATQVTEVRGGTVRIANSRTASGDWDWKTLIVSGSVAAELVTAIQVVTGYLRSVNGTFINLDDGTAQLGRNDGAHTTFDTNGMETFDSYGRSTSEFGNDGARIGREAIEHVLVEDGYVEIRHGQSVIAHFGYEEDLSTSIQRVVRFLTLGTRKAASSYPRGDYSSSFGTSNAATGDDSHARGNNCVASGDHSYAFGDGSTASGDHSVARGDRCVASGDHSVAIGKGVTASQDGQVALGEWNAIDSTGKYVLIYGDGSGSSNRSNLFALTNEGNCPLKTVTSGFTCDSAASSPSLYAYRCLNVVQLSLAVTIVGAIGGAEAISVGGSVTLGKLPAGCRPVTTAALDAGSTKRRATVDSTGTVTLYTDAAINDGVRVTLRGTFLVPESWQQVVS